MRNVLAILTAAGSLAVGMAATATTASAQADYWNGGWHVGGDYYQPTDYGYGYLNNYGTPVVDYTTFVAAAPMRTVQTVETVRTIRPTRYAPRRQIVTRRTTISQLSYQQPLYDYAGTAPAVSRPLYDYAGTAPAVSRPLYDYAGTAPAVAAPLYSVGYRRPLYDVATPVAQTYIAPVAQTYAAPVSAAPYYRYVYQWDRVLVIDPQTGLLVQTLAR